MGPDSVGNVQKILSFEAVFYDSASTCTTVTLIEGEYQKIISRASINGISADYIRVNGKPYVVGASAERHGVLVQRSGSEIYTKLLRCAGSGCAFAYV